jgi:hypothetical protein
MFHLHVQKVCPGHDVDVLPDDETLMRLMPLFLYIFDKALNAYQCALTYVSRQQTPQLWAATLIAIGGANAALGQRIEGLAIAQHLSAKVPTTKLFCRPCRRYGQAFQSK